MSEEEGMKEDFIKEEPIEVEVGGRKFKIKEMTGEEADNITNKYVKIDSETEQVIADIKIRNKLLFETCVVDAPYKKGDILFKNLAKEERSKILNKLKSNIRIPLLKKVNELNAIGEDVAKNSSRQS